MSPPRELMTKCNMLVKRSHQTLGWRDLPNRVTSQENMPAFAAAMVDEPDLLAVERGNRDAFRLQVACWVAKLTAIIAALAYSRWAFLALVVIVPAERALARYVRNGWIFWSTLFLAFEMLAFDFAGWGKAHPEEREQAAVLLGHGGGGQRTPWMDFYLGPSEVRDGLDPSMVRGFGPS